MPAPRLQQPGLDVGLAEVIEDEAGAGAGRDKPPDGGQLVVPAAHVEAQARCAEGAHAGDELRSRAEIRVDLALDQMADAANERVLLQPSDRRQRGGTGVDRNFCDDARKARLSGGELRDPFYLREPGRPALHENHFYRMIGDRLGA